MTATKNDPASSRPFVHRHQVQFVETDMAGIVHFSNIFRIMEEAEHAFLRSLGLSLFQPYQGMTISFPRTRFHCDFLSPARFEDELDTEVSIRRLGIKSVTLGFHMRLAERSIARGEVVAVCCRMEPGGKLSSIAIPEDLAAALARAAPPAPST